MYSARFYPMMHLIECLLCNPIADISSLAAQWCFAHLQYCIEKEEATKRHSSDFLNPCSTGFTSSLQHDHHVPAETPFFIFKWRTGHTAVIENWSESILFSKEETSFAPRMSVRIVSGASQGTFPTSTTMTSIGDRGWRISNSIPFNKLTRIRKERLILHSCQRNNAAYDFLISSGN